MLASLDYLGENVTTLEEAAQARDAYLAALRTVSPLHATVSMKQTALGLDISEEACRANCEALVRFACDTGTRVEMDMEDSSYTDRNLKIVHEMQQRHPGGVRAVFRRIYTAAKRIFEVCAMRDTRAIMQRRIQGAGVGRIPGEGRCGRELRQVDEAAVRSRHLSRNRYAR